MSIKTRLSKLENISCKANTISVICFTYPDKNEMSIGNPINFRGTIEQCKDLISKRKLSVVNIVRGNYTSRAV